MSEKEVNTRLQEFIALTDSNAHHDESLLELEEYST
jgi:hypothetical protein